LRFCELLKHIRFLCCIWINESWQNTKSFVVHMFRQLTFNIMVETNLGILCNGKTFGFKLYSTHTWMHLIFVKICSSLDNRLWFHWCNQNMWMEFVQNVCKSNYKVWACKWNVSNLLYTCISLLCCLTHGLDHWTYI